jgi:hypothetical protein
MEIGKLMYLEADGEMEKQKYLEIDGETERFRDRWRNRKI